MNIPNSIIIIILIPLLLFLLCPTILSKNQPCYPPNSNYCTCSGFESYCQLETHNTIFDFPNSGSFIVQNINYTSREIRLLDPESCLARKMMNLNISSTPFQYKTLYNQYYTLYKCLDPQNISISDDVHKIYCLSTSNYTVVAAPWNYSMVCDELGGGKIVLPMDYEHGVDSSSLVLTWSVDSKCVPQFACGDNMDRSSSKRLILTVGLTIGLGLPAIMCVAWCVTKIIAIRREASTPALPLGVVTPRANNRTQRQRRPSVAPRPDGEPGTPAQRTFVNYAGNTNGLDQPTLDSYPIVVIGESGRFLKSTNQEKICSICLSDYQINDTLKILPECLHRFHSDCIDEWLRGKALCPICRAPPPRTTF